jgi:RimJ/RimL family protein N-acetyltransferase
MAEPVTLIGRTVRLVPLSHVHAIDLLSAATENRTSYGFTAVPTDEPSVARYIDVALADQRSGWALPFAVVSVATNRAIGSTRFLDLDDWSSSPGASNGASSKGGSSLPRAVEIGSTWYAASAQRTIVNTESKLLLLSHAFEVWRTERVSFKTDARNERSRRAIERLGAQFEGVRRAHVLASDGTVRNSAYYSILSEEWPGLRDQLRDRLTT